MPVIRPRDESLNLTPMETFYHSAKAIRSTHVVNVGKQVRVSEPQEPRRTGLFGKRREAPPKSVEKTVQEPREITFSQAKPGILGTYSQGWDALHQNLSPEARSRAVEYDAANRRERQAGITPIEIGAGSQDRQKIFNISSENGEYRSREAFDTTREANKHLASLPVGNHPTFFNVFKIHAPPEIAGNLEAHETAILESLKRRLSRAKDPTELMIEYHARMNLHRMLESNEARLDIVPHPEQGITGIIHTATGAAARQALREELKSVLAAKKRAAAQIKDAERDR